MTQIRHLISGKTFAALQEVANKIRSEDPNLPELSPGQRVKVNQFKYRFHDQDGSWSNTWTVNAVIGEFPNQQVLLHTICADGTRLVREAPRYLITVEESHESA